MTFLGRLTILINWIIVPECFLMSLICHIMTNQWVTLKTQSPLISTKPSWEYFATVLTETLKAFKKINYLSGSSLEQWDCTNLSPESFFFLTRQLRCHHATRNRGGSVLAHDTANTPPSHNLAFASQPPVFPSVSSARKQKQIERRKPRFIGSMWCNEGV